MTALASRELTQTVTAIVLAGSRPGVDPLAAAAGVPIKALVPVGGAPMINHVVHTLLAHPAIGTVQVMAQDFAALSAHPQTAWLASHDQVQLVASAAGISQSLSYVVESGTPALPVLVTTADNVLLSAPMIDDFLHGANRHDLAVAMVERATLLAHFPQSRRTWLKFRAGWWSGANLFWLGSTRVKPVLDFWQGVEQDRKKGWKVLSAFGPLLLAGALLRLLTLPGAIRIAGRRFGVDAMMVPLTQAEACIDADKPDDVVLIEQILAQR